MSDVHFLYFSELYNWYGEELQAVLNPEDFETVIDCMYM